MKINILDSSVYNKISAGEVVENPSSVVKELAENSIDAGATNLEIYIEKGGLKIINVVDDGFGIEKQYLINSILPHATSKIVTSDDLFSISTLGFRGEALASISSVSDFTIETRYRNDSVGSKLNFYNGDTKIEDIAFEKGTSISVKNLFYNTPARFKFLKSEKIEESNVTKIVTNLILANSKVSIKYFVDGKLKLHSLGCDLYTAVTSIYGNEFMHNMLSVDYKNEYITIRGYISNHNFYKNSKNFQTIMVNGRIVENRTISEAIQNYYRNILVLRSFPVIVLNILLPLDKVDVNVHPSKKEVKFDNERFVASNVYYAVKNTNGDYFELMNRTLFEKQVPKLSIPPENLSIETAESESNKTKETLDFKPIIHPINDDGEILERDKALLKKYIGKTQSGEKLFTTLEPLDYEMNKNLTRNFARQKFIVHTLNKNEEATAKEKFIFSEKNNIDENKLSRDDRTFILNALAKDSKPINNAKKEQKYTVLGQIFETYLLLTANDIVLILDQHAVHERIIYDDLINNYSNSTSQSLMIPEIFDIHNNYDDKVIEEFISLISKINIEASSFGDNCIKIEAIPLVLVNVNLKKFMSEIWDAYILDKNNIDAKVFKEKLAKIACKSAIKGGDTLNEEKITYFVDYFIEKNMPLFCPHGRPTVIKLSKTDLEKMFRRLV